MTLKERRAEKKRRLEDEKEAERDRQIKKLIKGDYKTRGLDFCYYCGEKFNVGEKIPRILIHCGHTFCTECLT